MQHKKFKKVKKNIYEVENIFPEEVINKMFSLFKNHNYKLWKLISQKRPNHYSHVFKSKSLFLLLLNFLRKFLAHKKRNF